MLGTGYDLTFAYVNTGGGNAESISVLMMAKGDRGKTEESGQSGSLCCDIGGDRILAIMPIGLHNQSTAKTKT